MASNFPKLPGFVPTHDTWQTDHKKVSHKKLEQIRNAKNVPVPLYSLPRGPAATQSLGKTEENKSLSQTQFQNPFGKGEIVEQFEPTWVKLDKQVSFMIPLYLRNAVIQRWLVCTCLPHSLYLF